MRPCLLLVGIAAVSGCARYTPQPLEPARTAAEYRARRLDAAELQPWLDSAGVAPREGRWTAAALAVAAMGLRADLDAGRAEWRAATAGVTTARARPPIWVEGDLERRVAGAAERAPWVVAFTAPLTVELGGKRGARVALARARVLSAELALQDSAWRIAHRVRAMAAALRTIAAERELAEAEARASREVAALVSRRYGEGTLPSTEPLRAEADARSAEVTVAATVRAAAAARSALAREVGIPLAALDATAIDAPAPLGCRWAEAAAGDSLDALALQSRYDMGEALARYSVAEGELRLVSAGRAPDLTLAPGFIWDQGVDRWVLGVGLPGLIGRSRGPIAEATARRSAAGATVAAVQAAVLADVDGALAACRAARADRPALDSLVTATGASRAAAGRAYDRGEIGALDVAAADLALRRAERLRAEAQARELEASLAAEAAAGQWLGDAPMRWPDARRSPRGEGS
jgi:outer membrane protein TolC